MPNGQGSIDEKTLKDAMHRFIAQRVDAGFLRQHGAHAVSISRRKKRDGSRTTELCLVLHVDPGLKPAKHGDPVAATEIESPIQFADPVTGAIVPIPTDVVEDRRARLQGGKWRYSASSPVAGGMSCAPSPKPNFDHLVGTIGGWVWDLEGDTHVALSSVHVFGEAQSDVYHPDYASRFKLGVVIRAAPLESDAPPFFADCAIVQAQRPKRASFEVDALGPAVMATAIADENHRVEKVGFATKRTRGIVTNAEWSGLIEDPRTGVVRMFHDCLYIVPDGHAAWTLAGDSGSLVFAREPAGHGSAKPVIGLHIAGEDGGAYGIACRIDRVFERLGLTTLPNGLLRALAKQALGPLPAGASPVMREEREVEVNRLVALLTDFANRCRDEKIGRGLMALLDNGRAELVTILAQNGAISTRAAALIRHVFFGRDNVAEVRAVPIDSALLDKVRGVLRRLESASEEDLGEAASELRSSLPRAGTMTIGQFLAGSF